MIDNYEINKIVGYLQSLNYNFLAGTGVSLLYIVDKWDGTPKHKLAVFDNDREINCYYFDSSEDLLKSMDMILVILEHIKINSRRSA